MNDENPERIKCTFCQSLNSCKYIGIITYDFNDTGMDIESVKVYNCEICGHMEHFYKY